MMTLPKAETAILNGIYAAIAWLILDIGIVLREHGDQTLAVLSTNPEMVAGAVIVVVCIVGLFFKSRLAAATLFFLFVIPLVLRMVQGAFPTSMMLLFSFILLYFFLTAVLGAFSYHQLKASGDTLEKTD